MTDELKQRQLRPIVGRDGSVTTISPSTDVHSPCSAALALPYAVGEEALRGQPGN